MKLADTLINSNIYISLAAVFLTVETQIQLGMQPQWHPYLFLIFFGTLLEYNFHRFVTIFTHKEALKSDKHSWVNKNLTNFYILVGVSLIGFVVVVFMAELKVLLTLTPIALITILYSMPFFGKTRSIFRLREIPFLKIFLIAFVWATATIILPVSKSLESINYYSVIALLIERFLFIFAITIPFDIRDIDSDNNQGLKTIPNTLSEEKSLNLAYISLGLFFIISVIHFSILGYWFVLFAIIISAATTFIFLSSKRMKQMPIYHYGILDGTMLLQGLLVFLFYYINLYSIS
ncbi:MAG: UbiA family prenyltransferase [Saprospiraceae bacterium]